MSALAFSLRTSSDGSVRPSAGLALDAHNLFQRMHHVAQFGLRRHHGVAVLVRARRLVDHAHVLAALDALGRLGVIDETEGALGLAPDPK